MPHRMDHNTFVSLAGEDIIERLKLFDQVLLREGITEEFLTLYKIWNYFEKPDSLPNEKKDDGEVPEVSVSFDNQLLLRSASSAELIPSELPPQNETKVKIIPKLLNEKKDDIGMLGVSVSFDNQLFNSASDAKLNPSSNDPIQNESKVKILQNIVVKQPNTDTSYSLPSTSKSIGAYLVEPEKPARKNKRDIERISYAVTSRDYQESFEKKRALQLEKENQKLERKRKREENAAAKALKKTARASDNKNSCFVCKFRTMKNKYLTCDSCKKRIHRRCIPKKYEAYVPAEGDDDLFMCHICYTEESDEDVNSEIESEEDSEIDDRREIGSKIDKESKNNTTVSENQRCKERIETQCEKEKSEAPEDNNSQNLKEHVEKMLEKKHSVVTENVEECKLSDQMEIEEKIYEGKEKDNQNPEMIKNRVEQIRETNTDDEMEIDALFDLFQKEVKNYYK